MSESTGLIEVTRTSDREVRMQRVISAPKDAVWRAFTDPELLARWWGRGNGVTIERLEVNPGGHWRFVEHAPDGDFGFEGRYRAVRPCDMLSQTFEWDGAPGHVSVTTVEFQEVAGGGTRIVEDTMFMTAEDCDEMLTAGMVDGANQSFDALESLISAMC